MSRPHACLATHIKKPSTPPTPGSVRVQLWLGCSMQSLPGSRAEADGHHRPLPSSWQRRLRCPRKAVQLEQLGTRPSGCAWLWARTCFLPRKSAASIEAGGIIKQKRKSHNRAAGCVHTSVAQQVFRRQRLAGSLDSGAPSDNWIHTAPNSDLSACAWHPPPPSAGRPGRRSQ